MTEEDKSLATAAVAMRNKAVEAIDESILLAWVAASVKAHKDPNEVYDLLCFQGARREAIEEGRYDPKNMAHDTGTLYSAVLELYNESVATPETATAS